MERRAKRGTKLSSSDWLCVSFGGGTNSTAMLCGLKDHDIKPDMILFADTGAEMPHTYEHLEYMQGVVDRWWGMQIEVVSAKFKGEFEGIVAESLRLRKMPALAYGMKSCSKKFKVDPQNRLLKQVMKERGIEKAVRAIGFDAGEPHRVKPSIDAHADNWYPLVEWGWKRDDCMKAICRHKLPKPGKSSCYICPAMKSNEIISLSGKHPELIENALKIEALANSPQGKNTRRMGLGGREIWWADILKQDDEQMKLLDFLEQYDSQHIPCGCHDG